MSTIQVANLHLESTGNNRIHLTSANTVAVVAGGVDTFVANTTTINLVAGGVDTFVANTTTINLVAGGTTILTANSTTPIAKTSDILGKQTIWVPASAMYPRTTGGAAIGTIQSATNNINLRTLDFDTATYEFAQFVIQMPKSWNEGTLIFQFIWTHAATTTNFGVEWVVRSTAYANDDALDVAPSNDVVIADTGGTTNDIYITGETPPHTVPGSPAAEELVLFDVYRNYVSASDTMAVDARLIGVKIHYTVDAAKDD